MHSRSLSMSILTIVSLSTVFALPVEPEPQFNSTNSAHPGKHHPHQDQSSVDVAQRAQLASSKSGPRLDPGQANGDSQMGFGSDGLPANPNTGIGFGRNDVTSTPRPNFNQNLMELQGAGDPGPDFGTDGNAGGTVRISEDQLEAALAQYQSLKTDPRFARAAGNTAANTASQGGARPSEVPGTGYPYANEAGRSNAQGVGRAVQNLIELERAGYPGPDFGTDGNVGTTMRITEDNLQAALAAYPSLKTDPRFAQAAGATGSSMGSQVGPRPSEGHGIEYPYENQAAPYNAQGVGRAAGDPRADGAPPVSEDPTTLNATVSGFGNPTALSETAPGFENSTALNAYPPTPSAPVTNGVPLEARQEDFSRDFAVSRSGSDVDDADFGDYEAGSDSEDERSGGSSFKRRTIFFPQPVPRRVGASLEARQQSQFAAGARSGAGAGSGADAEFAAGAGHGAGAGSRADAGFGAGAGFAADADFGAGARSAAGLGSGAGSRLGAGPGFGAGPGVGAGPGAGAGAGFGAGAGSRGDAGFATGAGHGAGSEFGAGATQGAGHGVARGSNSLSDQDSNNRRVGGREEDDSEDSNEGDDDGEEEDDNANRSVSRPENVSSNQKGSAGRSTNGGKENASPESDEDDA